MFTTAKAEAKRALQVGNFCLRTEGLGEYQCRSLLQLSSVVATVCLSLSIWTCKRAAGSWL